MKTRLLIIIGIVAGILIPIALSAVIIPSIQANHQQDCVYDGGKVTGFLKCTRIHMDYGIDSPTVFINLGATDPKNKHPVTPKEITIVLGINNTVTWINADGQIHFINFEKWVIGPLEQGDKQSITFNQTGIYKYFSADATSISGTVIVMENFTESKVSECYALFHCDVSSEYFKGCIGGKKDGITIEELCSNSDIMIENGCVDVTFPDGTHTISCEQEIKK